MGASDCFWSEQFTTAHKIYDSFCVICILSSYGPLPSIFTSLLFKSTRD